MEIIKRWHVLAEIIKKHGLKNGVEIGAKAGENIAHVLMLCPEFHFAGVDCWDPNYKYQTWSKKQQLSNEFRFDNVVKAFPGHIRKIKMWSASASALFPDGSLDLIFIDGSHDFEAVQYDITLWLPKLRKGGFITGHDYGHPKIGNVKGVVDALFPTGVEICPDYVWVKQK
jgi:hypothetical protein